jgi:hypothetical protein
MGRKPITTEKMRDNRLSQYNGSATISVLYFLWKSSNDAMQIVNC